MKNKFKAGKTSVIVHVFIQNSSVTTGAGLTGLVFNSAGLKGYYMRAGASASVAITLATIATLGTFATGGFKEVDATNLPGVYELHVPNAAFAAGAERVVVVLSGATNMVPCALEIELDAIDYQDATRLGLTALPNANAGSNGGLPTGDASGRVTLIPSQSPSVSNGTAQAGAASTITLKSGDSATDSIYVGSLVTITSGTGANQSRVITGYVGSTKVATVDRPWQTNPDNTSVYSIFGEDTAAVDSNLKVQLTSGEHTSVASDVQTGLTAQGYTAARAPYLDYLNDMVVRTNTAQAGAGSTVTLDAGASATTDFYKGSLIAIISGTGSGQSRVCSAYNASTKVATVGRAWAINPDNTSIFIVFASAHPLLNSNLSVTLGGYDTGQDPATLVLATPSHKIAVDASGDVILTTGEHTQIVLDVEAGLTAQGYTATRAGYLDTLNGLVGAIWAAAVSSFITVGSIGQDIVNSFTTLLTGVNVTTNNDKTGYSLNLAQAISKTFTAETLGEALYGSRTQAFGKWVVSGTTLTLYAADGTTPIHTFTLDSAISPTQRV